DRGHQPGGSSPHRTTQRLALTSSAPGRSGLLTRAPLPEGAAPASPRGLHPSGPWPATYRARRTGRGGRHGLSGGISSTAITSSTATPTVHQNTRCTPAARPAPEGMPSGPVVVTAFTTAPKAATPMAEPRDRANTFVPVTAPRCAQATFDCAAISVGEAVSPIPAPITKQVSPTCQMGVPVPSSSARPAPPNTRTAPSSPVYRNPIRRYTRPE